MEQVYSRLSELLGESPNSILFRQFIDDLGETPAPIAVGAESFFAFYNSGIVLTTYNSMFDGVRLHVDTLDTRSGTCRPYNGGYPKSITSLDLPDDVEKKIGSRPTEVEKRTGIIIGSRDLRVSYELPPYLWSFTFDAITGRISIVSIIKSSD